MTTYTPEQLDRIDALVAEHVMGWTSIHSERHGDTHHSYGKPPNHQFDCITVSQYTRDGNANEEVIEHFSSGFIEMHNGRREGHDGNVWTVRIVAPGDEGEAVHADRYIAVCLAALKSIGVELANEIGGGD